MKKWLMLSGALVGMWMCAMLGYRAGSTKATDYFLREEMSRNLTNLQTGIKVAQLLKANQKVKAEELLENIIDVHVSSLGVQVNQKPYAPMRQEIMQSINEAKQYRTKWTSPDRRVNENLKPGVDAAFDMK